MMKGWSYINDFLIKFVSIFCSTRLDHFLNGFGVAFDEIMRSRRGRAEEQGCTIFLSLKHVEQRGKTRIIYSCQFDPTSEQLGGPYCSKYGLVDG